MEISKKYRVQNNPIPSIWMPASEMKKFHMCYVEYQHDILENLHEIDQSNVPYNLQKSRDELYDEYYLKPYKVIAYFTDNLKDVWGDDWNDPYHSAGEPYIEPEYRLLIAELVFPWYMREAIKCMPHDHDEWYSAEEYKDGAISYFYLTGYLSSEKAQKLFLQKTKETCKMDESKYQRVKKVMEEMPRAINSMHNLNEVKKIVKTWCGRFGFIREYNDDFIKKYSAFYQDSDDDNKQNKIYW